jgi:hypothetical protein
MSGFEQEVKRPGVLLMGPLKKSTTPDLFSFCEKSLRSQRALELEQEVGRSGGFSLKNRNNS